MPIENNERFSQTVTVFRERHVPGNVSLAGYAALIHAYDLNVPVPKTLCGTKASFAAQSAENWQLYSPRHAPDPDFSGHLTFALRYESVDLLILKRLFEHVGPAIIEAMVQAAPNGQYTRRAWFFYEWLLGARLDLPDAGAVGYTNALDPKMQITATPINSKRHRVRDNLPGRAGFCPLVTRTPVIEAFLSRDLAAEARSVAGQVSPDLLGRAAAFLLLKDSQASYAIEGERPPQDRLQRWGRAIAQAGQHGLSHAEFARLQQIVITDQRFLRMGYRNEGGYVGGRDRQTQAPIPEHFSARHEDIEALMGALIDASQQRMTTIDPVIAAAILAFGFVYIHPFADGNGRIHRYLMHHVLAKNGFNPAGLVFPISSAIEARIEGYSHVLKSHSARMFDYVEWRSPPEGNVEILNNTSDLYRFFDATPHVEFLFECVAQSIEQDLPEEVEFLRIYDRFVAAISGVFDMPSDKISLLFNFVKQNGGQLSKRAITKEFAGLTEKEARRIEQIYATSIAR